jgi:two-component system response regulator YesN
MINVMIVDDEPHIRQGIRNTIPWHELSMTVVSEAADGTEALKLYEQDQPDIVLLDINMPQLDGFHFLEIIRDQRGLTEVIFLTGYEDFDKVKKALSLQASDYLLKPVSFNELMNALMIAKEKILAAKQQTEFVSGLKKKVIDFGQAATDQYLLDIIRQDKQVRDKIILLRDMGIHFAETDSFIVACIAMDDTHKFIDQVNFRDRQLYLYAFRKIAEEATEHHKGSYVITDSPGRLILLLHQPTHWELETMALLKSIRSEYKKYLNMSISIGVSRDTLFHHLQLAYKEAIDAVAQKTLLGSGQIIPYALIQSHLEQDRKFLSKEILLFNELRMGNVKMVKSILGPWKSEIRDIPFSSATYIASQQIIMARRILEELDIQQAALPLSDKLLSQLNSCSTNMEIYELMADYLTKAAEAIRSTREQPSNKVIQRAKQWILKHISEEISLTKLSEFLHMSPNYLSTFFKQNTGETFSDFTNKVRFERAKELLYENDLKVYEVAERVGFSDANYFSLAFKKHTGYSPSEYREQFVK